MKAPVMGTTAKIITTTQSQKGENRFLSLIPPFLLAFLLFINPLVPDMKLSRPKLLVLETGVYVLLFAWLALSLFLPRIRLRRSAVLVPALCYAGLTAFLYFLSPDKPLALTELKRALLSVSAYLVASQAITSPRQRSVVLAGLAGGSLLAIVYGILQHSGGVWRIAVPHMDRVMSTFGNPIFFAAHLVTVLPLILGLLAATQKKFSLKVPLLLSLGAGLLALYYTQTRAAFIGFGVSLLVFFLLRLQTAKARAIFAAFFLAVSIFFFISTKNIWHRHQAHLLIWRDSLAMWLHRPWTGTGPGTFPIYFPQHASEQLKKVWPPDKFIVNDAHNEYVQYLSETGVVGFGVFLWLVLAFFTQAGTTLRKKKNGERALLAGCIASAAGLLTQNFFSVDMRFIVSSVYLFAVMGLADTFGDEYIERQVPPPPARIGAGILLLGAALLVFPGVLAPYRAERKVSATPDFFDEKILEPARTIQELEALARTYPNQSLVFEKLGWVYAKEKRWPEAIRSYERAVALAPGAAGPHNNLGNIYFLLGDRAKAIVYWERSLGLSPSQKDSRLNLAVAYYHSGRLKESSEQLKAVLELDPKNEKAIVLLKQMTE